jgi:hypothetical protein
MVLECEFVGKRFAVPVVQRMVGQQVERARFGVMPCRGLTFHHTAYVEPLFPCLHLAYAKILQIPGVVSNPCTPHIVLFSLYSSV